MIKITEKKRPRILPHGFTLKMNVPSEASKLFEVYSWIFVNLGEYDEKTLQFRINDPWTTSIYFLNPEDALAFKLRWI